MARLEPRHFRTVRGQSDSVEEKLRVLKERRWTYTLSVYGAEGNNEATNPHKPVRTNYLVGSLPGGRHVEVEAIIVLPPGQF